MEHGELSIVQITKEHISCYICNLRNKKMYIMPSKYIYFDVNVDVMFASGTCLLIVEVSKFYRIDHELYVTKKEFPWLNIVKNGIEEFVSCFCTIVSVS